MFFVFIALIATTLTEGKKKERLSLLIPIETKALMSIATVSRQGQRDLKALSEEILYYWPVVVPRMHIAVNKHACYIVQLLLLRQRANRHLLLSLFMGQSSFLE